MIDRFEQFERLAIQAQTESSPLGEISLDRIVLKVASAVRARSSFGLPILLFATAASLLAVFIGGAAYVDWSVDHDPLISLLEPLQVVMR